MARNEEKQLGKLNRLWLQKEKDEGRIRDVHEPRPKLVTLNSVASVKKWIPGIKREIEYYLQQSQLPHYPERKIEEFRQRIDELEREYKRYAKKLRSLDPTCKHKPWEPRAYTKRRPESSCTTNTSKKRCLSAAAEEAGKDNEHRNLKGNHTPLPSPPASCVPLDQDVPLSFDRSRMAIAVASSRVAVPGQQKDTGKLTRVLLRGLPNLQTLTQAPDQTKQVFIAETNQIKATPHQNKTTHLPGLDCYSSSSDEEV
ncbi:hypothetical protein DNTS_029289 [Danionella cerebrum]|uniref:Uncharacterized protein n=1 Tax=Danionella cerebrum TaxID=2873325 RepID=A0A553RP41_9TELE|nr:hypothetical protein DNTS_029289 [Danionella translucida]